MSSIYRKGRDGYYYYQTYIRNPETGKKDKRIFHSLGTKNKIEAERKQAEYDNEYEKRKNNNNNIAYQLKRKYKIFIIIIIPMITFLFISKKNYSENNRKILIQKNNKTPFKNNIAEEKVEKQNTLSKNNKTKKENIPINQSSDVRDSLITQEIVTISQQEIKTIPIIPEYTIERIERLSGAFQQGKIFITVRENTDSESLLMLCDKITTEHKEFSNLVICLYTNSVIGKDMALGKENGISKQDQKECWLAMYTYNPVEGAYFDDNPGGYLGAY